MAHPTLQVGYNPSSKWINPTYPIYNQGYNLCTYYVGWTTTYPSWHILTIPWSSHCRATLRRLGTTLPEGLMAIMGGGVAEGILKWSHPSHYQVIKNHDKLWMGQRNPNHQLVDGLFHYPLVIEHSYWKWPIDSWFTYWRWWFSIVM